jgi:6-pyruvoyltetrahydropterin/6-carboxytetrahydropterin synthase
MFEVMIEDSFAAAHRLLNYEGICEKQHGHNWKVQVFAVGEHLDESGILVDFKVLNAALKEILNILDHTDLNNIEEFVGLSPSSELIARYIYKQLKPQIKEISKVTVWETERSRATYCEKCNDLT